LSFPVFFLRRQSFCRGFHHGPYILAAPKIAPNRGGWIQAHVRNAGTPETGRNAPGSRPERRVPNANNSLVEIQTKLRNSLERVDYVLVLDESLL